MENLGERGLFKETGSIKLQRGEAPQRERLWNFPQQGRGVPRRGEPAVRQPSTPASETQSDATGVLSEQFSFIVLSSWFIKASRGVFARDFP